jgi:hypothetical protein
MGIGTTATDGIGLRGCGGRTLGGYDRRRTADEGEAHAVDVGHPARGVIEAHHILTIVEGDGDLLLTHLAIGAGVE